MLHWIAKLFGRRAERRPEPLCVKTLARDGMRLGVYKFTKNCGHHGYAAELEVYLDEKGKWLNIAMIHGDDLTNALWLLYQAVEYIDGVHQDHRQVVGD